ncbi:MAG: transposase [Clostridiales bacterium]|nr:transposase [Clostridiales bacterium]
MISAAIEISDSTALPANDGIGIDIGLKDTAVCSDKIIYKNINKTVNVKKLKKKQRRLQRKISKKYLKNKKGESYCKTSNIIKSEKQLIKVNHRLTDIRHNYQHQVTTEILKRKPNFIVLENLNVAGMMKNKHLAKAIQEQGFYEFYRQIKYKAIWNNIKFIEAPRFYPSSKLCCICKNIKSDLKLSDRVCRCSCGNVIDRDYQASVNLYDYGKLIV